MTTIRTSNIRKTLNTKRYCGSFVVDNVCLNIWNQRLAGGYCYTEAEVTYAKQDKEEIVIRIKIKKRQCDFEKFEVFVLVDEESDDFNL